MCTETSTKIPVFPGTTCQSQKEASCHSEKETMRNDACGEQVHGYHERSASWPRREKDTVHRRSPNTYGRLNRLSRRSLCLHRLSRLHTYFQRRFKTTFAIPPVVKCGHARCMNYNPRKFHETPSSVTIVGVRIPGDLQSMIKIVLDSNEVSRTAVFDLANRQSGRCPSRAIG